MKVMGEREAEEFLDKNHFPITPSKFVKTLEGSISASKKIGFPVVLKIVSKKHLHKTDVGGVKPDLRNEYELVKSFKELKKLRPEGFLVQKFIKGENFIVGLKKDPSFGHVLTFGLGGIYTEVLKDVSLRICPVKEKEIEKMISEIKSFPIISGVRGKKLDIMGVKKVLTKTNKLVNKHQNIKELDINPLVVNHKESVVVDARIIFE